MDGSGATSWGFHCTCISCKLGAGAKLKFVDEKRVRLPRIVVNGVITSPTTKRLLRRGELPPMLVAGTAIESLREVRRVTSAAGRGGGGGPKGSPEGRGARETRWIPGRIKRVRENTTPRSYDVDLLSEVSGWGVYCYDLSLLAITSCCFECLLLVCRRSTYTKQ